MEEELDTTEGFSFKEFTQESNPAPNIGHIIMAGDLGEPRSDEEMEESMYDEESHSEQRKISGKEKGWANVLPHQFKKGQSGNPGGRPAGKSLKQYTREMLAAMSDEERQEFLHGIPKIDLFKMAEGNPESKTDITSGGEKITSTPELIALAQEYETKLKENINAGTTISPQLDTETPNPN